MAGEPEDLWQTLLQDTGTAIATEEDYEHGYQREVRRDLRQYVAFRVGKEIYGLPIETIEEISKVFDTTPVPRTASFVVGIGNVRGNVMPVIDLPTRLALPSRVRGQSARVLIVNHAGEFFGLVVDEVLHVLPLPPESLEDAPGAIGGTRGEFIAALARNDEHLIIILNLDTLLHAPAFLRAGGKRR